MAGQGGGAAGPPAGRRRLRRARRLQRARRDRPGLAFGAGLVAPVRPGAPAAGTRRLGHHPALGHRAAAPVLRLPAHPAHRAHGGGRAPLPGALQRHGRTRARRRLAARRSQAAGHRPRPPGRQLRRAHPPPQRLRPAAGKPERAARCTVGRGHQRPATAHRPRQRQPHPPGLGGSGPGAPVR